MFRLLWSDEVGLEVTAETVLVGLVAILAAVVALDAAARVLDDRLQPPQPADAAAVTEPAAVSVEPNADCDCAVVVTPEKFAAASH